MLTVPIIHFAALHHRETYWLLYWREKTYRRNYNTTKFTRTLEFENPEHRHSTSCTETDWLSNSFKQKISTGKKVTETISLRFSFTLYSYLLKLSFRCLKKNYSRTTIPTSIYAYLRFFFFCLLLSFDPTTVHRDTFTNIITKEFRLLIFLNSCLHTTYLKFIYKLYIPTVKFCFVKRVSCFL